MMETEDIREARSLWGEAWRRLRRDWLAMTCLVVISLYLAVGILSLFRLPYGSGDTRRSMPLVIWTFAHLVGPTNKDESYVPPMTSGRAFLKAKADKRGLAELPQSDAEPTGLHVMGTDIHGRDVLMLTIQGINTAVVLGFLTALVSIPLGILFGTVAGYLGGRIDDAIVYVYSTLACVPGILLLVALMQVMGKGILQLSLALGVTGWVGLCRLIRGQTLMLREAEYVLAARAVGAGSARILVRHIVPNLFHIVIISFTLGFGGIVMSEAVLTYIGLGVSADRISWGQMIEESRMELSRDPSVWWPLAAAGAALMILVLAFNIFGDRLRDALDPKLKT